MDEESNWVAETGKRLRAQMDERQAKYQDQAAAEKKRKEEDAEFYRNMKRAQHECYHVDLARIAKVVQDVTQKLDLDEFCWLFLTADGWSVWKAEGTRSWLRKHPRADGLLKQFNCISRNAWTDRKATTNMNGPLRACVDDMEAWALKQGLQVSDPSTFLARVEAGMVPLPFSENAHPCGGIEAVTETVVGHVGDRERHLGFRVPVPPPPGADIKQ
jgi:hypothetical protein